LGWAPPPVKPLVEFAHPTWYITPSHAKDTGGDVGGTVQGRITCKAPPAQTFPDEIDACLTSRWPGGVILSFDLDQIEMKVAALLSGDTTLVSAYTSSPPVDLHTTRALDVFTRSYLMQHCGLPFDKTNDTFRNVYRNAAKHDNFRGLYRGGSKKLQMTIFRKTDGRIILPLSTCERAVATYPSSYPGLWRWQQQLIVSAHNLGYVELPLTGQSRMFAGGSEYDVNEIVNQPIQTTAGNVLLRIQAYVHHHGDPINTASPRYFMIHQVYDSILFDTKDKKAADAVRTLMVDAVTHEQDYGYWHDLCTLYDRTIPLTYTEAA